MKDDSKVSFLRDPSHISLNYIDEWTRHFHSFSLTPEAEPWPGNTRWNLCSNIVGNFWLLLQVCFKNVKTHGCKQNRALHTVAWKGRVLPEDALTSLLLVLRALLAHSLLLHACLLGDSLNSKIRRGAGSLRKAICHKLGVFMGPPGKGIQGVRNKRKI